VALLPYNTFRTETFNWANANDPRFHLFWPLQGGWEHWVQAEVAAAIINVNSAYEILREQPIYTNGQVCDWLLNEQTGGNSRIAVELKCQRGTDPTAAVFIQDIANDIQKLNGPNLPGGVQGSVVGIFYSNNAMAVAGQLTQGFTMQNHRIFNQNTGIFVAYKGVDF
jgi:hypothetical protein